MAYQPSDHFEAFYEETMEHVDVGYHREESFALSSVDMEVSKREQVRLGESIDHEHAILLAELRKTGHKLPAIVVWRKSTSKVLMVEGLHRTAGFLEYDYKTHPAYVVTDTTQAQVDELKVLLNIGPKEIDVKSRLVLAREEVTKGATFTAAAKHYGVTPGRLKLSLAAYQTHERLRERNVRKWAEVPQSVANELARIGPDRVVEAAARLYLGSGENRRGNRLGTEEMRDLAREIQSERRKGEKGQLAVVDRWAKTLKTQVRTSAGTPQSSVPRESETYRRLVRKFIVPLSRFDNGVVKELRRTELEGTLEHIATVQRTLKGMERDLKTLLSR